MDDVNDPLARRTTFRNTLAWAHLWADQVAPGGLEPIKPMRDLIESCQDCCLTLAEHFRTWDGATGDKRCDIAPVRIAKAPMPVSIKTIAMARPASVVTSMLVPSVLTVPMAHHMPVHVEM